MRIRLGSGILPLNLLVIALVLVVLFSPSNVPRVILGIPFLLFFPGYTLVLALFPRREGLSGLERVALSFALSIAIVPLIGFILNYTQWGIALEPVLYSIAGFIVVVSAIAWFRQSGLPEQDRLRIGFGLALPGSGGEKALSVLLALTIVAALGSLVYVIAVPKTGESFTEFYLLDADGQTQNYPRQLVVGDKGQVIVGISNQEQATVTYRVEVSIDGVNNSDTAPLTLAHEEVRELPLDFAPDKPGDNQKVAFLLFKDGSAEAYLSLFLNIDVSQ